MSPYDDPAVSAGEIADYLHSQAQLMPDLRLIAPPALGETSCLLLEGQQRQTWTRVQLDGHQLDYFCHQDLHAGWLCWHHEGRYLSDATLRYLVGQQWPGAQPGL